MLCGDVVVPILLCETRQPTQNSKTKRNPKTKLKTKTKPNNETNKTTTTTTKIQKANASDTTT